MTTLRELSQLKYEATLRRYPDIPTHAIPRYSDKTPGQLFIAIADYFQVKGITGVLMDINSTHVIVRANGSIFMARSWSDFIEKWNSSIGIQDEET